MGSGMIWNCDHRDFEGYEISGVGFAGIHIERVCFCNCEELQDRFTRHQFADAPALLDRLRFLMQSGILSCRY